MRYYIHIPLPENIKNAILAVEKEYQGDAGSDPHITIISPREIMPGKEEAELVSKINSAVEILTPPLIFETKVGYFENKNGNKETIYVGLKRTKQLLTLHAVLRDAVSDFLKPTGNLFADLRVPHITLATRLTGENREKAWAALKDKKFFLFLLCDQIALLKKDAGDKRWQAVNYFEIR